MIPRELTEKPLFKLKGVDSLVRLFVISLLASTATPVFANNSFYNKLLFSPSDSMLKAETRGRIMIYDGMDSETIERAMDEQFNRIDNMMFTRIHHVQENGEEYVDDDGLYRYKCTLFVFDGGNDF